MAFTSLEPHFLMSPRPKSGRPKGSTPFPRGKGQNQGPSDRIEKATRQKSTSRSIPESWRPQGKNRLFRDDVDPLQVASDLSVHIVYMRKVTSLIEEVTAKLHKLKDAYHRLRDATKPIERTASELCDKGKTVNAFSDKVKNVVHAGESAFGRDASGVQKIHGLDGYGEHMLRVAEKEFDDAF
ncbi:unnamed protein product [Penicillium pancosmium]